MTQKWDKLRPDEPQGSNADFTYIEAHVIDVQILYLQTPTWLRTDHETNRRAGNQSRSRILL